MQVPEGADIVTSDSAQVFLKAEGQPQLLLLGEQDRSFDSIVQEVLGPAPEVRVAPQDAAPQVDTVLAMLSEDEDPFAELDATEATLTGEGEGGASFVRLQSILEVTTPLDLAYPRPSTAHDFSRQPGALEDPGGPQLRSDAVLMQEDGTGNYASVNGNATMLNPDGLVLGSVLLNDVSARGFGLQIISFNVNGSTYPADGQTIEIRGETGYTLGHFSLSANGDFTFKPAENYSGGIPSIGYVAQEAVTGQTASAYLDIKIIPVADAPLVDVKNVQIFEDGIEDVNAANPVVKNAEIQLKVPQLVDILDLNGPNVAGDDPERAGFIKLTVQCDGVNENSKAQLLLGDEVIFPMDHSEQSFLFIIVDDNGEPIGEHIAGVLDAAIASGIPWRSLTQSEYESLVLKPAANAGENIHLKIEVGSYEVDAAGKPLPGIDPAVTTKTAEVDVWAVTDTVSLKWADNIGADAQGEHLAVQISENHYLNLKGLLFAQFQDLDGSEERNICIKNNSEEGVSIWVNGNELKPGEVLNIAAPGLSKSTQVADFPEIKVGLPPGVTGTATGIEVTLIAKDRDWDSTVDTKEQQDSVYLNLDVAPASDVALTGKSVLFEDIPGSMLESVAGQEVGGDRAVSYFAISGIPEGWMIFDAQGQQIYPAAEGAEAGSGLLVLLDSPKSWADFESYIKGFQVQASAQSAQDGAFKVDYAVSHPSLSNPNITQETAGSFDLPVQVKPVAERVGDPAGDNDLNHGLTMTEGHSYQSTVLENEAFDLNVEGFDLKAGWHNPDQDGSESTAARMHIMWLPQGADLAGLKADLGAQQSAMWHAKGAKLTWINEDGDTEFFVFDGVNPINVPMEFLHTVKLLAPPYAAGEFAIRVEALTTDTDVDSSATDSAVSGEAWLDGIKFNPVAQDLDDHAVQVGGGQGNEDTWIALKVTAYSVDEAESYNVKLEGIPQDATIRHNGVEINVNSNVPGFDIVRGADGWSLVIRGYDREAGLDLKPPHNSNEDFVLQVSAQTVDVANGVTSISQWTNPKALGVGVKGIADWVEAEIDKGAYEEAQLDQSASTFSLMDMVRSVQLHDRDGSESMTFKITGVPKGFNIVGAQYLDGGEGEERAWFVRSAQELELVKIVTPRHYSGTLAFKLIGITTEKDGDWSEGLRPGVDVVVHEDVVVEITPSPESQAIDGSVGLEDALRPLNFGIANNFGDGDERLDAVYIKIDDVEDKAFSLYLDGVLLSESGVEQVDGYYKLTGDQLGQLQGKANVEHWAHKPGETGYQFGVKFDITDPSTDGTLDAVTKQISDTYTFKITAVTDQLVAGEASVSNVNMAEGSLVVDGNAVSVRGVGDFSVQFQVTTPDMDGSEQLVQFVVEGIPEGMVLTGVNGGGGSETGSVHFLGDGRWMMSIPSSALQNGQMDVSVSFHVGDRLSYQNGQSITITAVSVDPGASSSSSASVSWTLVDPGGASSPADDVFDFRLTPKEGFTGVEDTAFLLADAYDVSLEIQPGYEQSVQVSLQLTLPEGCTVTYKGVPLQAVPVGGVKGESGGEEIWLVTVKGGLDEIREMLENLEVTPPPNLNDNFPGGFTLDTKVTVFHESSGAQFEDTVEDAIPLTPVTDPGGIEVTLINQDTGGAPVEGSPVEIHVRLSSGVDGGVTLGDSIYLQLQSSYGPEGTLTYNGAVLTAQTLGADNPLGLPPGEYYVIPTGATHLPIGGGTDYELVYTPAYDELYSKGDISVKAWVDRTEAQAGQTLVVNDGVHVDIPGISNGYDFTLPTDVVVDENQGSGGRVELKVEGEGLRDKTDGSEEVNFVIIKNLPSGFLVYVGEEAAGAVLAGNAGGNIYGGRVWNLPLDEQGNVPAYIAIQAPKGWSGILPDLEMVVVSHEIGAEAAVDIRGFQLNVTAVADGVILASENKVLGSEGQIIDLNLSITMKDPSAVQLGGGAAQLFPDSSHEVATLQFSGIGAHAAFYVGTELLAWNGVGRGFSYDPATGKYLVYGLSQSDIQELGVLQTKNDLNAQIDFQAWTNESENWDMSEVSSGTLDLTIKAQSTVGTDGNDIFLFDGESFFSGGEGEDTVTLRFGEDLDFQGNLADKFQSIEVLDLTRTGFSHEVNNLSASDVLKMTDDDNTLTILLDHGDKLNFSVSDTWVLDADKSDASFNVYTTTLNGEQVEVRISAGTGAEVGINGQAPVLFSAPPPDHTEVDSDMAQRVAQQMLDDGKNALDGSGL